MNADESNADGAKTDVPRQAIVKSSARRARLAAAPNTDPSPESPVAREEGGLSAGGSRGENDDRLKQDRPPHW